MELKGISQKNIFKTSNFTSMLDTLFGWRKASKCKEMINSLRRRLMALRREMSAASETLREDIALFLMNAQQHIAFAKIDELHMNEGLIEVYEWLDSYCQFVLLNFSYIKRHRTCKDDLNEAISTLVFASERLENLPELQEISKLFRERYGCKFVKIAMESQPGCLVNPHVKEKLCRKSVPEEEKQRLLDAIVEEFLDPADFIEIECKPNGTTPEGAMLNSITNNGETVGGVEEFKSPATRGDQFLDDQDRRVFIYMPLRTQNADKLLKAKSRKSRRRSSSSYKDCVYKPLRDEVELEVFYGASPGLERDEFVPSFRIWLDEKATETLTRSRNLSKLPSWDELEVMFMGLKQIHQHTTS